jgi:large subunit ribosomal protein L2
MPIKELKPTTPGQRGMTTQDFSGLTKAKAPKSLRQIKRRGNGRNNQGRITVRHKGGGSRKFYRLVNFNLPEGVQATVEQIEYDPNRSARIALIKEPSGQLHYILAANGLQPGQQVSSGQEVKIEAGNRLSLKDIPVGTTIHAVEMKLNGGAQMVRSAGTSAQLMGIDNGYAQIRLPSGEVRLVDQNCQASIGAVGNEQHQNIKIGKAGRKRHMGVRPTVRGVVMNAVDHPHGGGDGGRHGVGGGKNHGSAPKTPWGQKTLGYKTRRRKSTTKYIVRSRHESKRR